MCVEPEVHRAALLAVLELTTFKIAFVDSNPAEWAHLENNSCAILDAANMFDNADGFARRNKLSKGSRIFVPSEGFRCRDGKLERFLKDLVH